MNLSSIRPVRIAAASLTAFAVLGLAACASSEPFVPSPSPGETSTAACSELPAATGVTVSGDFLAEPKVTIDAPLDPSSVESTVVIPGDGEEIGMRDVVYASYSAFNGTTGEEIESTNWAKKELAPLPVAGRGLIPGLVDALPCATVGSRVAVVIPADLAYGDRGRPGLVDGSDPVVFVVDIDSIAPEPLPTEESR